MDAKMGLIGNNNIMNIFTYIFYTNDIKYVVHQGSTEIKKKDTTQWFQVHNYVRIREREREVDRSTQYLLPIEMKQHI